MLPVQEARARILSATTPLASERLPISSALFRVLAEDVFGGRSLPPHDASMRDGYAVRAQDVAAASDDHPARLRVTARSEAGHPSPTGIGPGEAARIMTGAALPAGADAVVMQERTRVDGDEVLVLAPARTGDFVRPRGSETQAGALALPRGTLLAPAALALLAELGRSVVLVHQRPRVALIATGDELCELDEPPGDRIVDSNTWGLSAQVLAAGCEPVRLPIARDELPQIERALTSAARCEVVLTSAGISVGERDFVKEALANLGVTLDFWQVAMRPGKPLAFGARGEQLFFGLPGNPTSGMVCFEQFVRPALLRLQGRTIVERPLLRAVLEKPAEKEKGFTYFVRAATRIEDGRLFTQPVSRQDSGLASSMAAANSLIVLGPDLERAEAGDEVFVQPLDSFGA
ncbi:MAG: gephyrin-like molybdotransferase Glp [Myxococcales bacterium]|jgi:molybdopterin molybdotransferase